MSVLETRSRTGTSAAPSSPRQSGGRTPARGPAPLPPDDGETNLKLVLIAVDVAAASAAWLLWSRFATVAPAPYLSGPVRTAALAIVLTMLSLGGFRLYRSRVCSVHAVEIAGIGKAAALAAVGVQAFQGVVGAEVEPLHLVFGAVSVFLVVLAGRRGFRAWIARRRRAGRHLRPVVVVGTNDEGRALVAMLRRNPEAGYQVVGLLGDRHGVANTGIVPWLGQAGETADVVRSLGANGAFFAASALALAQLNDSVRELMADGSHVHLSSSLRGIDARRIRLQPISRELLFHLEPVRLRRWEERTKRVIDISLAGLGLVVAAPILAVVALAVRLHDGGSPLFRQVRVGRGGRTSRCSSCAR